MSKISKESLIASGVGYVVERNMVWFKVSDVKKKIKGSKIHSSDIYKKEVDGKFVQVVKCEDIKLKEVKSVEEIKVVDPEFIPCSEECGCLMSQEDAEKALCKKESK